MRPGRQGRAVGSLTETERGIFLVRGKPAGYRPVMHNEACCKSHPERASERRSRGYSGLGCPLCPG